MSESFKKTKYYITYFNVINENQALMLAGVPLERSAALLRKLTSANWGESS